MMVDNPMSKPAGVSEHDQLRSIVAAMWVEYNRDQHCDQRHINQLIEDAAAAMLEGMSMEDLDALGFAHKDNPIWKAINDAQS